MWHEHQDIPYAAVFDATPASLLVLTPDLVIRDANRAYLKAVGRSREELLGRYIFDVFPESADPAGNAMAQVRASLERARDTGQPDTMAVQRYDIPVAGGGFEQRYWSPIQVPVLDENGIAMLLLHRAEDVTDFVRERTHGDGTSGNDGAWRRRMQEVEADLFARGRELQALNAELREAQDELVARALHDPMTGLLIRPAILEQVSRALSRTARQPLSIAVLFIDLDHLKHLNDVCGHAAGDDLIRCFGEHLRTSVRPCDSVARFGGDEFVVLLEDLRDGADAEVVAERVLVGARACRVPQGSSTQPSASIGIAVAACARVSAETLISQADQAMYRAKRSGGDRYEVFHAGGAQGSATTAAP